jgi:stage II sporulation protein D (peptidoglycan lytic transglycosylase)
MQRRAFLAAGVGFVAACAGAPSRGVRPATRPPVTSEPLVRVGLAVGVTRASFQPAGGRYLIHERQNDDPIAVVADGETWGMAAGERGDELRVVDQRGWLSRPHARPVRVEPLDGDSLLRVGDARYAGALELLPVPGGLTVVNELPLERYLRGVLAREMSGSDATMEAVKAQAIAARTYALKRMGSRAALGFDLFGDVQDQAYGGEEGVSAAVERALSETRGQVMLSEGLLIDAYFHSTCGGTTAAVEEAFPESPVPYLVSVDDDGAKGSFYCEASRYFRWQARYDRDRLESLLGTNLGRFTALPPAGLGDLYDMDIAESSPGGRVLALRIETSTGSFQVVRNDIRWLFAESNSLGLRSTLFLLRKERRGGVVDEVALTGGGWGHGVGMCQVGALGRAAAGASHPDILAHYYRGVHLERLYG